MATFLSLERKRLGLHQSDVYEKINVGKSTYIRWEKGNAIPSDKLAELEGIGFDILYVVTGRRKELQVIDNGSLISIDDAVEAAKYAAREAVKSVYQAKRLRKELDSTSQFDVMKSLELIERAAAVLARAEITGELNTSALFEALTPVQKKDA
ncbi:helix-turn-helix transcriptional regulator [Pseudoalteromonas maricaloris]|uniref:helix-turn-helix transcriptional regulator n=1 Tax=Pseudoalteromonas maricaloris TaxID=184924 RepID=UPI00029A3198|nr:helix-turn-helix transcriptional regulator [Pseudoalteromonas flavipulchra]